jgi:hypothetical protein
MMNQHEYLLEDGLRQRHHSGVGPRMLVVRRLEQLQRYYWLLLKPADCEPIGQDGFPGKRSFLKWRVPRNGWFIMENP